jgi:hypothetical protein
MAQEVGAEAERPQTRPPHTPYQQRIEQRDVPARCGVVNRLGPAIGGATRTWICAVLEQRRRRLGEAPTSSEQQRRLSLGVRLVRGRLELSGEIPNHTGVPAERRKMHC